MKNLKLFSLIILSALFFFSCSNIKEQKNEIQQKTSVLDRSNKTVVSSPAHSKTRYGTNPNGEGVPEETYTKDDGTVVIIYRCINSPEVCYTYGAVNANDGEENLTALLDNGVWYQAYFGGKQTLPDGSEKIEIYLP
jgi:hypothetical protein